MTATLPVATRVPRCLRLLRVHVPRLAADEGLVYFHGADSLLMRAVLHR